MVAFGEEGRNRNTRRDVVGYWKCRISAKDLKVISKEGGVELCTHMPTWTSKAASRFS